MTIPQTILITLRTFGENLFLNNVTMVARVKNHMQEAMVTPRIKSMAFSVGKDARKAPKRRDPSIQAWGLNQVTTHAVPITFKIG